MPTAAEQLESPTISSPAWLQGVGLLAIAAFALLLRTLHTDAPFASADHVMIAYRTTCEPGWRWCFQNHYGPLQPILTKLFALAVTGLGIPMTETLWRLPMGIVGAVIPILAFVLARRAGGTREAAWWAAIWTAVLPPLVTDARYMWAYETLGVAVAMAVLIATFAYLDRPTAGRAWIVGVLLAIYLQSHLHVYAVPCVVLLALLFDRTRVRDAGIGQRIVRLLRTPGLWLPPAISLCVLMAAWHYVGGGPIARVITKTSISAASPDKWAAAAQLARAWLGHIGIPVAILLVASLAAGRLAVSDRTRPRADKSPPSRAILLAAWALLFAAPLFALGFRTGRPTQYLTQATTGAMILTAVALFRQREKSGGPRMLIRVASAAVAALLVWGSIDANLYAGRHSNWTGVTAAWGAAVPNAGYKSAGWLIRKHIPADAVIFALHDTSGLESPVATYYFSRACLAGEDWSPEQAFAVAEHFETRLDVIVDDLRVPGTRPDFWSRDFVPTAVIRDGEHALLRILVRADTKPTLIDIQVESGDRKYDAEFGPREMGKAPPVPIRLPDTREVTAVVRALPPK